MSQFICPICGADKCVKISTDEYVTEVQVSGDGHVSNIETATLPIGWECVGCTVVFGDPEKFSKKAAPCTPPS